MNSRKKNEIDSGVESIEAEQMMKYGITRVSVDYYVCGEYRYTDLKDAVAQGKRAQHSG